MKIFKSHYRIVTDRYAGYTVQKRYWWCPFWFEPSINTHATLEGARDFANKCEEKVVEYL